MAARSDFNPFLHTPETVEEYKITADAVRFLTGTGPAEARARDFLGWSRRPVRRKLLRKLKARNPGHSRLIDTAFRVKTMTDAQWIQSTMRLLEAMGSADAS